jgi:hypothetical protein
MMLRAIPALLALLLLGSACIGGGDKAPSAPATRAAPEATATVAGGAANDPDEGDDASASSDTGAIDTVFESLLGGGLSGASGSGGSLEPGDPALKALLPSADEFPAGFVPFGEFTFSTPDGVSEAGKIDLAMSMAIAGDIDVANPDLSSVGMLMAMVMKPEDLQDLGDAFGAIDDLDPDQMEQEILAGMRQGAGGALNGVELTDVQVFKLDDLGDGGFGMQMTMDMSGRIGGFGGASGEAPPFDSMTMRMYIFAHGDYVGATMRLGYSDTLPPADDELALARVIDGKLASAP